MSQFLFRIKIFSTICSNSEKKHKDFSSKTLQIMAKLLGKTSRRRKVAQTCAGKALVRGQVATDQAVTPGVQTTIVKCATLKVTISIFPK